MSNEEKCVGKEPRKVIARVISQEGYCAIGHKIGDTIEFEHYGVKGILQMQKSLTKLDID